MSLITGATRHGPGHINKLCGRPPQYAPTPCKLTFDLLTVKVVSESRVTWATSMPSLVFLGLSILEYAMYATDRQTSDTHHRLMPPPYGGGHNNLLAQRLTVAAPGIGVWGCSPSPPFPFLLSFSPPHPMSCDSCPVPPIPSFPLPSSTPSVLFPSLPLPCREAAP